MVAEASCARLPHLIPRHCKTPNPQIMAIVIISFFVLPARMGERPPLYSAMTMETAAGAPQVGSQAPQPRMNPAQPPRARPEKLYWPRQRAMAATSSALEDPR